MRLLPPATIPGRVLAISVDVPRELLGAPTAGAEAGDCFAAGLSRVFESYGIPVTWGFDEPVSSGILPALSAPDGRHEIALRCVPSAESADGNELRKQIAQLRAAAGAGLRVSTLMVQGQRSVDGLETLARHGINLVTSGEPEPDDLAGLVRTLRFGMWQLAASWQFPGRCGWFGAQTAAGWGRRRIDRAIARDELVHLAIDGAALARSRSGTRTLERILRHVAQRRREDLLEVLTLGELARQLPQSRSGPTAGSILKTRAA